ncbi:hypothetical protein [Flavobacterium selenitireducens]|uniref:hypothetical protein n=1 Tax=Flavobacterium selenitireducens TaxID=2722704 RepID=UPI00168B85CD|nr:hypothetical protein [Flavobacterium selenitireducens]MBD3581552.1 hypothetical protein [Flavobacterium selenitireducens]
MSDSPIDINSGVQANVGMDFQRNCSLYIFLEKYPRIRNDKYFIILEHYDDIVFGFLNSNDELDKIETFQAKKSSKVWTNSDIFEIVDKIIGNGIVLLKDSHAQSSIYIKEQFFVTNNTIILSFKNDKNKKVKVYINETNETVHFHQFHEKLQESLQAGNSTYKFDDNQKLHFSTLNFSYLDFGRNTKTQLELLVGKFREVFGNSILDHQAARDTFLNELDKLDSTYNQGNKASLSDKSKRLESSKINEILDVITTHKLALEFCRSKGEKIREKLKVSIFESRNFELNFENSLDRFKDLTQGEHQKILEFVNTNSDILRIHFNDEDCIEDLYNNFLKQKNTTLTETQLKAAISAAYFLIKSQP